MIGVSFDKSKGGWYAIIFLNGFRYRSLYYKSRETAVAHREEMERRRDAGLEQLWHGYKEKPRIRKSG